MSREFVCAYSYETPDGTEWFQKVRYKITPPGLDGRDKDFRYRWRRGPGYVWVPTKREGADDLIYNLRDVLDAVESGDDIWWCEGEKDADALIALGIQATSHHGGAGKVTIEQASWFAGHHGTVVLLMDLDPDDHRGGNPGAADVILRYNLLREVGIRRDQVAVVHARSGKDAADHLVAGFGVREFISVRDLTALYEKAARTTAGTFGGSGYLPPGWEFKPTVINTKEVSA